MNKTTKTHFFFFLKLSVNKNRILDVKLTAMEPVVRSRGVIMQYPVHKIYLIRGNTLLQTANTRFREKLAVVGCRKSYLSVATASRTRPLDVDPWASGNRAIVQPEHRPIARRVDPLSGKCKVAVGALFPDVATASLQDAIDVPAR